MVELGTILQQSRDWDCLNAGGDTCLGKLMPVRDGLHLSASRMSAHHHTNANSL